MNDLEVLLLLVRVEAGLARQFDTELGRVHGVSLADFAMLRHLASAQGDRMRRTDLARAVGLSASGVTRGLAPLERIGLVRRETDDRDARVAYAILTETGRERLAEMTRTAEALSASVLSGSWSTTKTGQLRGLLALLEGRL